MSVEKFTEQANAILEAQFESELLKLVDIIPMDDWTDISRSPKLTIGIINRHPELPWDWNRIGMIPSITFEFVMEHLAEFKTPQQIFQSTWFYISKNPNITWDIVIQNPQIPWRWDGLSQNPSITMDIVLNNIKCPWVWKDLSYNASGTLTLEIVMAHLNKKWDWTQLSRCLPLYAEILDKYPELPWNWNYMSANKSFTPDFWESEISSYTTNHSPTNNNIFSKICGWVFPTLTSASTKPMRRWDWNYFLSLNPSILIQTILDNPNYPWDWTTISCRKDATWEIVQKNLDKPWNWKMLSSSETITWDMVISNPQIEWDYTALLFNPNVTYENLNERHMLSGRVSNFCLYNNGLTHKDSEKPDMTDELRYLMLQNPMDVGYKRFVEKYVDDQLSREIDMKWLNKVAEKNPQIDMRLFDYIGKYL